MPSQVGREVGADTVKIGIPTPAVGPVGRARKLELRELMLEQEWQVCPPG